MPVRAGQPFGHIFISLLGSAHQVFIAAGNAEDALAHQLLHRVVDVDKVRGAKVSETGRELSHQPEPPVSPVQQNQPTVRRDVVRIEMLPLTSAIWPQA